VRIALALPPWTSGGREEPEPAVVVLLIVPGEQSLEDGARVLDRAEALREAPAGATERLEKLCRYAARPPVVHERLSLTDSGKVLYKFKRTFRDGSSHSGVPSDVCVRWARVMDPLTLIERLAALVPRPLVRLVTYHGMFAPAAPLRDRVVPPPPQEEESIPHDADSSCAHRAHATPPPTPTKPRRSTRKRYSWADLMRRVFHIDVFLCECGGLRRLLAFITDNTSIRRILTHLGLPPRPTANLSGQGATHAAAASCLMGRQPPGWAAR